jgi:tetratricopeptide (TPR) repeat protein
MAELATIQPPPFTPARLRGVRPKSSEQFREAMDLYAGGDYQGAIPGLIAASDADRGDASSRFFLGICFLMVNKSEPASEAFRRALALGDSPYEEEAHFYLGKALLRLGQIGRAGEELRQVIEMHGDLEAAARQLRGELQKIPPAGGR